MWRPVLARGDGVWIGSTGDGRLWVGSPEAERAPVLFDDPVFLWPLLENPYQEVASDLVAHWPEFGLPETVSPPSLIESIIRSAVAAGRPYWIDRALNWIEAMAGDPASRPPIAVESVLHEVANARDLPQTTRHRAMRIARLAGESD